MSESTRRTEAHLTVLRAMRAEGSMMGVPTELEALDAAIAALSVPAAPAGEVVAWAAQNRSTGKFGYIWHTQDDVRGWIDLQHQSSDACTWAGPIPLYSAPPEQGKEAFDTLRGALRFYAGRSHFLLSDQSAWDTVSGEPQNLWCDQAGTATVEDGEIARQALAAAAKGVGR